MSYSIAPIRVSIGFDIGTRVKEVHDLGVEVLHSTHLEKISTELSKLGRSLILGGEILVAGVHSRVE